MSDGRLDILEADRKRMTRDIQDLFSLIKVGTGVPSTAGSNANFELDSATLKMINSMESELALK